MDVALSTVGYDCRVIKLKNMNNDIDNIKNIKKYIAAIDPGRYKFGFAVCDEAGKFVFGAVIKTEDRDLFLDALVSEDIKNIKKFLLGLGTSHKIFAAGLAARGIDFSLCDEKNTTIEARKLYFELHPPKGILKLIPISLRTPPCDIDDLAAWALIKRNYP